MICTIKAAYIKWQILIPLPREWRHHSLVLLKLARIYKNIDCMLFRHRVSNKSRLSRTENYVRNQTRWTVHNEHLCSRNWRNKMNFPQSSNAECYFFLTPVYRAPCTIVCADLLRLSSPRAARCTIQKASKEEKNMQHVRQILFDWPVHFNSGLTYLALPLCTSCVNRSEPVAHAPQRQPSSDVRLHKTRRAPMYVTR